MEIWRTDPSPQNLAGAVDALRPQINYHLHRYGLGADPLAVGQARLLAAKAVQSYSPDSGASMHTWLDRSMQPLSRFKRLRATPVKVPEKIQLDSMRINQAATDFEEEHGREPELDELADCVGMPIKRIDHVRRASRKMVGEAVFEGNLKALNDTDHMSEALEAVWDESDKLDRRILELRIGYGGKTEPLPPNAVAARLKLSPVALSRRSQRIAAKLDEILEALEST